MIINKKNISIIESEQFNIHDAEINDFQYKLSKQTLTITLLNYDEMDNKIRIRISFNHILYIELDNHDMFSSMDTNWLYGWETFSPEEKTCFKRKFNHGYADEFGILITFCNLARLYIVASEIEWNKTILDI